MKLIGLCGRSGCGKSEAAGIFAELGVAVLDSDVVYAELIQAGKPLLRELFEHFGSGILDSEGGLDRKRLADLVFSDTAALDELNGLTHPAVLDEVQRQAEALSATSPGGLVIVQVPLLFESGFDKICYKTVAVVAEDSICIERIMARDGLTELDAARRISTQKSSDFLRKNCDFIIENHQNRAFLAQKVQEILMILLHEERL